MAGFNPGLTLAESGHNVIGLEQNEISLKNYKMEILTFKKIKKALQKNLKKRIKFLRKFIEFKNLIHYFIIAVGIY